MYIFYPSCNFTAASPRAAQLLQQYMAARMAVGPCCRAEKRTFAPQDTAVYFCQACREVLQQQVQTLSLWQYLDAAEDFPWPDYGGRQVLLQDCWRDRDHPQIHAAVRSVLAKMNLRAAEVPLAQGQAAFCGNLHLEPPDAPSAQLLAQYAGQAVHTLPQGVQSALMRAYVRTLPGESCVVCCCNRCTAGIQAGGRQAVHLASLAMGCAPW